MFSSSHLPNQQSFVRFFQEKHQGQYWIWNLCVEKGRDYDKTKFEVGTYRFLFIYNSVYLLELCHSAWVPGP